MRTLTLLMVLGLTTTTRAQELGRAPEATYDLSVLAALFPLAILNAGDSHGDLVGASFELRALLAKRIGIALTPLAFATGEMDDVDRGRMRRHGGGPRVQLFPARWPVELVVGYDLSLVHYATGNDTTFIFRSVRWESHDTVGHSFSLRLDGAIGNRRAAFRLGLLIDGGFTADQQARWLSAGVSLGLRLRPRVDT